MTARGPAEGTGDIDIPSQVGPVAAYGEAVLGPRRRAAGRLLDATRGGDGRSARAATPRGSDAIPSGAGAGQLTDGGALVSEALNRLAGLAARLLGSASAQVSLLTDVQTVAGGSGLPPGAVGSRQPLADSLCTVTADGQVPLVVSDARSDHRVAGLSPVTSGAVGSYLGVPMTSGDGHRMGAMCVFDPAPRQWSDADLLLLEEIAAAAMTEVELSALETDYATGQVMLSLAVESAGIGTFDWDLVTGRLDWDERLIRMFGLAPDTFDRNIQTFNACLHEEDRVRVAARLEHAIAVCGDYEAEYRIVLPTGEVRWIAARGRALAGDHGAAIRLLGAAYDATARREGEARLSRVLESMSAAFISVTPQWSVTYVNAEAERLSGVRRERLVGRDLWAVFPGLLGSVFEDHYRRSARTGEPVTFEAYFAAPLHRWLEVRAWPGPDGLTLFFNDISDRRRTQAVLERVARRAALLAEVSAELIGTLDVDEALSRLSQLVVPTLADWCIATLIDSDAHTDLRRGICDVGSWHVDAASRVLLERHVALRRPALTEASMTVQALRTGRPVIVQQAACDVICDGLADGEAREIITELAPDWAGIYPLRGRGRIVGLLSLFSGAGRGAPTADEWAAIDDVIARAGLALDNARLFTQQRQLAEGLQRSLLTPPPESDHMQVVVRYEPAAEAAQVGGDWYDAFLQPGGATMLVIGDVVGHDTAAAAAMGQLRSLLRGIAASTGDGPADVLSGVDHVMRLLAVDTTATAVVARIEQSVEDCDRGVTLLRWSNAGHPPPMVVQSDGRVSVLATADADLLLGIVPDSPRTESTVTLDRGATVLLYTDGLVERRGQSLDEGLALLRNTLVDLADASLDEMCDEVLRRLLPEHRDDDVALVAVRLHRPDRPRPAEGRPNRVLDGVPATG